jgi:hypothetical protein
VRFFAYFTDGGVPLRTRTCRVKAWAHDNAFTLFWITAMNAVGMVVTVIQCH